MFNKHSLKTQINIIISIIILVIMIIVSMVLYNFINKIFIEEMDEKISIINSTQKKLIKNLVAKKEEEITVITENPLITLYTDLAYSKELEKNQNESSVKTSNLGMGFNELITNSSLVRNTGYTLKKLINTIDYAEIAYITTPTGTLVADSRLSVSNIGKKNIYTGEIMPVSEYKDINMFNYDRITGDLYFFINRKIYRNNKIIGYCVVGLSIDIFKAKIDTYLKDYGQLKLLTSDGIILIGDDNDEIGQKTTNEWYIQEAKNNNQNVSTITEKNYFIMDKVDDLDLYLATNINLNQIQRPARIIRNYVLYISLLIIILIIISATIVLIMKLRPLNFLIEKMQKVREGNFDVELNVDREDEIGKIGKIFNKMVLDIKKLLNKVKDDQEQIRKYEFQTLQSQINPHFLYNTLDFINWMTRDRDFDKISKMVVALSKFFRLSLNEGKSITSIGKEIEHIKNYLLIQKLRYEDKFDYEIKIDDNILNKECIKIILQPLVENSIKHGLKEMEIGGYIMVNGYTENNKIFLIVEDNGKGIDVNRINMLMSLNNSDTRSGYAIRNVNKRIHLYYSDQYGLSFYNKESGGACFKISLPVKKFGGEKDVQDDDN